VRSDPVPSATYRLQLQPGFGFREAAAHCGYLADLGVSHLYLSPILQAAPGSTHGYDVVDHRRLSAELGGEPGWGELVRAARAAGLGLVVDITPNHMGIPVPETLNQPFWDVLEHGPDSAYAHWFDIDWAAGDGAVVLPILRSPDDESTVDGPVRRYYDHVLPPVPRFYRLVHWRDGDRKLNYRRFFTITSMIALRVEEPDVFAATHQRLLDLVAAGDITGLRVDHPDGLADPLGYLHRLREAAPGAWIVVEKILMRDETLPADWPVAGTTGYDALNAVSRAFVDAAAEPRFTHEYQRQTGCGTAFPAVMYQSKREVTLGGLRAETDRLCRVGGQPVAGIADLLARWPVYRTYLRDAGEFITRLQQTTGMVMAKGVEDRAFYRYHRLAALCEVGGDPADFGLGVTEFHDFAERLAARWPATMTALTTHDTKRSEDVRARILALTEVPEQWAAAVDRWRGRHAIPDPNLEYLFWQTLVGAAPISPERMTEYLLKAAREAATNTTWTDPDVAYENRVGAFVAEVYRTDDTMAEVVAFVGELEPAATAISLGAKLVQLTMPGVPDLYQGSEHDVYTLVDPDNRGLAEFGGDDGTAKWRLTRSVLRLRRAHPEWYGPDAGYQPMSARGPAVEHLLGFRRGGGPVTIVTRLARRLAEADGWGDTSLDLGTGGWRDVFSGREFGPVAAVGELLGAWPVALLVPAGTTGT
jgi:(1->4)-alpha-D-glucan 1-alpha-D-glucosylmutase